jgi:ABC-type lipoprotein release transport system permease subunit
LIFLPSIIGLDGFDGGFAMIAISIMLFLPTGITVMVIYKKRARLLNLLLSGENLIAYWQYGIEEWQKYAEEEYLRNKANKKIMFIILLVISAIVGILFLIIAEDKEAALVVVGVLV